MKRILFYIFIGAVFITQIYMVLNKTEPVLQQSPKPPKKQRQAKEEKKKSKPDSNTSLHLRESSFTQLPGWETSSKKKSLEAFQISCHAFLKQNPEKSVGSKFIDLKVKDWVPACKTAVKLNPSSEKEAESFFQTWFKPVEFYQQKPLTGLFTGYYMPLLHGSLKKTARYNIPIYALPKNLISANLERFKSNLKHSQIHGRVTQRNFVPYYTRAQINQGAIAAYTPVLVWVDTQLERLKLEIEGSGFVKLTDGRQIALGYAGENGAPYRSLASALINRKKMTADNASMPNIRRYLKKHPQQVNSLFNQNKSFVFFTKLRHNAAVGAQGVPLTPGYSLAIDRKWIPMGAPLWLNTTQIDEKTLSHKPFHRLMIAQDTGGAIKGMVRGDVYWGAGEKATKTATQMKNPGHYWLLLPRHLPV